MMHEKRAREEIIKKILELLILNPKGLKVTYLMEKSNTSYIQLKEILDFMFKKDWLVEYKLKKLYIITQKGINTFIDLSISLRSVNLLMGKKPSIKEGE